MESFNCPELASEIIARINAMEPENPLSPFGESCVKIALEARGVENGEEIDTIAEEINDAIGEVEPSEITPSELLARTFDLYFNGEF